MKKISNFNKLANELERKGESPKEAKGVAAKVGFEKYGKKRMEAKAKAGKKRIMKGKKGC